MRYEIFIQKIYCYYDPFYNFYNFRQCSICIQIPTRTNKLVLGCQCTNDGTHQGRDVTQSAIVDYVLGTIANVTSGDIENEKKAVNYATLRNTTLRRSALSFAATKSELDTGEPIYIQLAWNVGGAHAVVVSGYNTSAGTLTIVDPAKGCGTKSFSYNSMITGCTFQSGTGKWSNSITI